MITIQDPKGKNSKELIKIPDKRFFVVIKNDRWLLQRLKKTGKK